MAWSAVTHPECEKFVSMVCIATYTDPRTGMTVAARFVQSLSIGRQPREPGLAIASGDVAVSRVAIELRVIDGELWIANTSRYSPSEVRASADVHVLEPGGTLTVPGSCVLLLPGSDGVHEVSIARAISSELETEVVDPSLVDVDGAAADERLVDDGVIDPVTADPPALDRTMPMTSGRPWWGNRLPVLAALCASRLAPDEPRFQFESLEGMVALLTRSGYDVTTDSVNSDLLAVRDQIAAESAVRFVSRAEFADFLVANQMVTQADLDVALRSDAPSASVDPELAGLVSHADQMLLDPTPIELPRPGSQ